MRVIVYTRLLRKVYNVPHTFARIVPYDCGLRPLVLSPQYILTECQKYFAYGLGGEETNVGGVLAMELLNLVKKGRGARKRPLLDTLNIELLRDLLVL